MTIACQQHSLYLISNSVLRQEWEKMGTVMVWGEESFISAEGLMKLSVKGLGKIALVGEGHSCNQYRRRDIRGNLYI